MMEEEAATATLMCGSRLQSTAVSATRLYTSQGEFAIVLNGVEHCTQLVSFGLVCEAAGRYGVYWLSIYMYFAIFALKSL